MTTCFVCGIGLKRTGFRNKTCGSQCSRTFFNWNRTARAQLKKQTNQKLKCFVCTTEFVPARSTSTTCSRKCRDRSRTQRSYTARSRASRYGLTTEALEQHLVNGCYAPGCGDTETLVVDHDHKCCSGRRSCGKCVRGALCNRHNLYLGFIEKDPAFAVWALEQLATKEDAK
jgi:hypothetical protein